MQDLTKACTIMSSYNYLVGDLFPSSLVTARLQLDFILIPTTQDQGNCGLIGRGKIVSLMPPTGAQFELQLLAERGIVSIRLHVA